MDQITQNESKWRASERDRINDLRSKGYQEEVQRQGLKHGLMSEGNKLDYNYAKDRNNLYQGLGQSAAGAYTQRSRSESQPAQFQSQAAPPKQYKSYDDPERERQLGYGDDEDDESKYIG